MRGGNLQTRRATWYDRPMKSVRSLHSILLPAALVLMSALFPRMVSLQIDAIDDWLDSVVLLVTGSAYCSGVVIDDTELIATAYHCISNGRRVKAWVRPEPDAPADAEAVTAIGRTVAAEPKTTRARPDLAAGKVPPMAIRDELPRPGEPAFGLGHPAPAAEQSEAMEECSVECHRGHRQRGRSAAHPDRCGTQSGQLRWTGRDLEGQRIGITPSCRRTTSHSPARRGCVRWSRISATRSDRGRCGLGVSGSEAVRSSGTTAAWMSARPWNSWCRVPGSGRGDGGSRGLVLRPDAGPGDGSVLDPALEASPALRQRIGRGQWSTTVELGGGRVVDGLTSDFDSRTGPDDYAARPQVGPLSSRGSVSEGRADVTIPDDPENPLWLLIDPIFPG